MRIKFNKILYQILKFSAFFVKKGILVKLNLKRERSVTVCCNDCFDLLFYTFMGVACLEIKLYRYLLRKVQANVQNKSGGINESGKINLLFLGLSQAGTYPPN